MTLVLSWQPHARQHQLVSAQQQPTAPVHVLGTLKSRISTSHYLTSTSKCFSKLWAHTPQDHWSTVVVRTLLWCSNRQHLDNWTSFALTFSWPFCLDRGPKYLMLLNFLFPKWTGPPLQVLRLLMVKNVVILFCSDYI